MGDSLEGADGCAQSSASHLVVLARGLYFPEGPRWKNGSLWFSDILNRRVLKLTSSGALETVAELDCYPCGLGFMPDGAMLISTIERRHILRQVAGELSVHADLSDMPGDTLNDMIVTGSGTAYVGTRQAGDDAYATPQSADVLIKINPNGSHSVVAEDLFGPNGIAVIGRKLIVAETMANRLTEFTMEPNGGLSHRRMFADLGNERPDGICADSAGGIWFASIASGDFIRLNAKGVTTDRVASGGVAIACALGGKDGRTLYLLSISHEALQHSWSESDRQYVPVSPNVPTDSGTVQATSAHFGA